MRALPIAPGRARAQAPGRERQAAACALLVRPACFAFNTETADSNRFQCPGEAAGSAGAAQAARVEFERLRGGLETAGVRLCVVEDTPVPAKPDAIFPNNWVSWHADGTVVLYPLHAPDRRPERRSEVLARVEAQGWERRRLIDLTGHEREGRCLEGTGSLVLDRSHRIAYACRSARTDAALVRHWAGLMDYEPVIFDAAVDGAPVYHTNVLLAIGGGWAVVCAEAIAPADRARVLQRLRSGGRDVVAIGLTALREFAANILELEGTAAPGATEGSPTRVLALSRRARAALEAAGVWPRLAGAIDHVVAVAVPTIERLGGGSVRCMLAEVCSA